ncbi:hypothetical protein CAJCM15448_30930 [Candidozyma auris]|nr:hypothetical protein CAJCM15448_30930 [[Candida] auris]
MKFSTVAIALTAASAVSAANQTGGGKNDSGNQTSSSVGGMAAANAMGAGVIGAAAAAEMAVNQALLDSLLEFLKSQSPDILNGFLEEIDRNIQSGEISDKSAKNENSDNSNRSPSSEEQCLSPKSTKQKVSSSNQHGQTYTDFNDTSKTDNDKARNGNHQDSNAREEAAVSVSARTITISKVLFYCTFPVATFVTFFLAVGLFRKGELNKAQVIEFITGTGFLFTGALGSLAKTRVSKVTSYRHLVLVLGYLSWLVGIGTWVAVCIICSLHTDEDLLNWSCFVLFLMTVLFVTLANLAIESLRHENESPAQPSSTGCGSFTLRLSQVHKILENSNQNHHKRLGYNNIQNSNSGTYLSNILREPPIRKQPQLSDEIIDNSRPFRKLSISFRYLQHPEQLLDG